MGRTGSQDLAGFFVYIVPAAVAAVPSCALLRSRRAALFSFLFNSFFARTA